jgi:hypothetical protein
MLWDVKLKAWLDGFLKLIFDRAAFERSNAPAETPVLARLGK